MHGREKSGALASAELCGKAFVPVLQGRHLQYVFHRAGSAGQDEDEQRRANLVSLLDGYFSQMAHHINVNVLSRETLVEAVQ